MKRSRLLLICIFILTVLTALTPICACLPKNKDKGKDNTRIVSISLPDSGGISLGKFRITSCYATKDGSMQYCMLKEQKEKFKNLLITSPYFFCESYIDDDFRITLSTYAYDIAKNSAVIWLADEGDIWCCQFYSDDTIHIAKAQDNLYFNDDIAGLVNCGLFACKDVPEEIGVPYKTRWSWAQLNQLVSCDTQIDDENKILSLNAGLLTTN